MLWTREAMAVRAARGLQDGFYVNLGIGIPTLVAHYVPGDVEATFQSENGMLGIGPFPFKRVERAPGVTADAVLAQTSANYGVAL